MRSVSLLVSNVLIGRQMGMVLDIDFLIGCDKLNILLMLDRHRDQIFFGNSFHHHKLQIGAQLRHINKNPLRQIDNTALCRINIKLRKSLLDSTINLLLWNNSFRHCPDNCLCFGNLLQKPFEFRRCTGYLTPKAILDTRSTCLTIPRKMSPVSLQSHFSELYSHLEHPPFSSPRASPHPPRASTGVSYGQ